MIPIHDSEVHIWPVNLSQPQPAIKDCYELLAADERARAGSFLFDEHRNRYIVARGNLRRTLGRYLDRPAGQLRFEYSPNGKPFFACGPTQFNISHSGDLALIAVTKGREVGVDVERLRRDDDLLEVAEHYFAPQERAALRSLPAAERCFGFFRCWTRKEAYLKARGDGLSMDLHGFVVSLGPDDRPALLESAEGPAEVNRWTLAHLDPHPGYAAALAVEGRDCDVRFWHEELAA